MPTICVAGGAGFIGSITSIELLSAGYDVVVLDSLINAKEESIKRIEEISGKSVTFYKADLMDKAAITNVFSKHKFDAVIHFAGLKAVGESVQKPLLYYHNNITGTLHLLEVMQEHKVTNLVFSSSATVYGNPQTLPLDEEHPVGGCTNPYGKTKFMIEEILRDYSVANPEWNIVLLRYFNPIGAHPSGRLGEDPQGIPNNLLPYVAQVAVGRREFLSVFGGDYDTPDGTGVRDYIHVMDLATGHVAAIKKLEETCGCVVYNLGTGVGVSVLEIVKAFKEACGKEIAYKIVDRRNGDVASCYSDASKAERELKWKATRSLEEACKDAWHWQSKNPNGYSA